MFSLFACSSHTHVIGSGPSSGVTVSARQYYVLWGLVPVGIGGGADTNAMAGDAENFDISLAFGLSASDHLALHGLRANLKTSKALAERYEEVQIVNASPGVQDDLEQMSEDSDDESESEDSNDSAQKSLDFF